MDKGMKIIFAGTVEDRPEGYDPVRLDRPEGYDPVRIDRPEGYDPVR